MNARWRLITAMVIGVLSLSVVGSAGAQVKAHDAGSVPTGVLAWVPQGPQPCPTQLTGTYSCFFVHVSWNNITTFPTTSFGNSGVILVPSRPSCNQSGNWPLAWGNERNDAPIPTSEHQDGNRTTVTLFVPWNGDFATFTNCYSVRIDIFSGTSLAASVTVPLTENGYPTITNFASRFTSTSLQFSWSPPLSTNIPSGVVPTGSYTAFLIPTGPYSPLAVGPSGDVQQCVTSSLSCTFTDVPVSEDPILVISANTSNGPGPGLAFQVEPSRMYVVASPTITATSATATVVGLHPFATSKIGIPGSRKQCIANTLGQCSVTFNVPFPGTYPILATSIGQSATATIWHPLVACPSKVAVGRPITVRLSDMPPSVPVIVKTNTGQVLNTTSSTKGTGTVAIPTTGPEFVNVTATIGGVPLPAVHLVQVS